MWRGRGKKKFFKLKIFLLKALPPSVREAVALVHARQLQKMVNKHIQPEFASVVPAIGENGFSNLWWIYLEWQPDMVMK